MINISYQRGSHGPFKLKMLTNTIFQIHSKTGGAFEGPKHQVWAMAEELGVFGPDLDEALDEMLKLDHDYATFGIGGRFVFTGRTERGQVA